MMKKKRTQLDIQYYPFPINEENLCNSFGILGVRNVVFRGTIFLKEVCFSHQICIDSKYSKTLIFLYDILI